MAASIELNGRGGTDANELADGCAKNDLPTDWLPMSNRYISPVGFTPGQGSILLAKSRLDKIDLTGKLELSLTDDQGGQAFLPNIRAVGNPRCIDAGTNDPIYLVNLSDARIDVIGTTSRRYQWRFHPTDDIPFVGTDGAASIEDVIEQLWAFAPSVLGDFPGLPDNVPTPSAAAIDRTDLHGFRIADALEDMLAALGCGVSFDVLAETDPWSVVYFPGATDEALDLFDELKGALEYDEDPYSPAKFGNVPASVSVIFPIWPASRYGRIPRKVWVEPVAAPSLSISLASGATRVSQIAYLQDYMPARVNANFDVQNAAALTARAAQVSRIFFDRFTATAPQWPIKRSYRGIIKDDRLIPGGSFDLIGWTVGESCRTFVARTGLTAQTELYEDESDSGIRTDWNPEPAVSSAGVVLRTGGTAPEIDRERSVWGLGSMERGAISLAGGGVGPYFKRGSALRQGEWASAGTGGKTDQRGRLWRNWEDFGPDDMDRFVLVGVFDEEVGLYPCTVLRQEGRPTWPQEEAAWAEGANGEALVEGWIYRAHAGTDIVQGKIVWGTACCEGSESGSGAAGPGSAPGCCPPETPLPDTLSVYLDGDCLDCLPLSIIIEKSLSTGRHTGSANCTIDSCTYTFAISLQCYPCSQSPLDADCVDLNCESEDYYYCVGWSLTASGSGCEHETQSGSFAVASSAMECPTIEGTILLVGCDVTVRIGTSIPDPPCQEFDFSTATCTISNQFGSVTDDTAFAGDVPLQSSGTDQATFEITGDGEIRVDIRCHVPDNTYRGQVEGNLTCAGAFSAPFTAAPVFFSASPFVYIMDVTYPFYEAPLDPPGCAAGGFRVTITIP